ncbi:MAG: cysteine desulfurase [Deltaproteobacteria bacterium]|nr:cysteine desulfurase [Deltaproteobacteria bacterium]
MSFDVEAVRAQFPILHQEAYGRPLVYLDSGATSQKPRAVIDAMSAYYERDNANVHRGVHLLSMRATEAFEGARATIARFLGGNPKELVFVRGATEAINLVAFSWGRQNLGPGDEILLSGMEHHANIVPWQMVAEATGAKVRSIPLHDDGSIDLEGFDRLLTSRTKMVGVVHVSNALGTVNPVAHLAARAHEVGAKILVDGAQATLHTIVDVAALDVDFYAMSGHKVYGPTGIGALWGRAALLEAMPPYMGGGDMIRSVTFEKTTYAGVPARFEAGTPNISGAIGLGAALDWFTSLDREAVFAHEAALLAYGTRLLESIPGVRLVGTASDKVGVLGFVIEGVHPHDVGTVLDQQGVAVRTGHHCAQPVMERMGVPATTRASLAVYNTTADLDRLGEAVEQAIRLLGR